MNAKPAVQARFLTGSIMRHVVVTTLTGAVGLMSMFLVDFADLYFLSLLNDTHITAAIGFAGTLGFINLGISLGLGIASAALVARNLGAGDAARARELASSSLAFTFIVSAIYTISTAIMVKPILAALGASGEVLELAARFIWIVSPGYVMLAAAVSCSFSMRGLGDPRRAMYITLAAAVLTAIADPIFIFGFKMGIAGAAVANVLAEAAALAFGLYGLGRVHQFLTRVTAAAIWRDLKVIWPIALPAMLTQLATPFASAYTTAAVSVYGDETVAASAIIGRLVPVAFGMVFSLSGSVGPIIGQNFGNRNMERVRQALVDGLKFAAIYTVITAFLLLFFRHAVADIFQTSGRARELVVFFCTYIGFSWVFAGSQFVANAAFNNLGYASLSTWYNWGKATLGTIPFAIAGSALAEAEGLFAGIAAGSVLFGIASVVSAFRIITKLSTKTAGHANH